mgnify:CR=1 FL=1
MFRLATFNVENLDLGPRADPPLSERITVLRPQLQRLRADILCLQEVNAQKTASKAPRVLAALDQLLEGTAYADMERAVTHLAGRDSPADKHNLVVISRFPIEEAVQLRHDLVAAPSYRLATGGDGAVGSVEWDRPAQRVVVRLPGGQLLHVFNLHLRAPIAAHIEGQKTEPFTWKTVGGWAEGYFVSSMKRSGQALEVRLDLDRLFDADAEALIAVCGDLNATENEVPLRILLGEEEDTGNGALAGRALIAVEKSIPTDQRYSVIHHGRRQLLDHMLVSRALMGWYVDAELHNEDLGDELVAYRDVHHPPDSYHAPLVARFEAPE